MSTAGTSSTPATQPTPQTSMAAYLLFSEDIKAQLEKEQPNLKLSQVAREITRRWNAAGPHVQQVQPSLPPHTPHSTPAARNRSRHSSLQRCLFGVHLDA